MNPVKKKRPFDLRENKKFLLLGGLLVLLAIGLGFGAAFLIFKQPGLEKPATKKTPLEKAQPSVSFLPKEEVLTKKLDSKWVHPADQAHEGVFEMWTDGTFTFRGLKSADFASGGNWRFDRNVIILEFTEDLDYWRPMFANMAQYGSSYPDIGQIKSQPRPSAIFDVFACEKRTGRACINLFNWLFYKEINLPATEKTKPESKSDEESIWEAVYDYAPRIDMMASSVDFELDKIVGNYALVQVIPEGNIEGAALILEKISGTWVVQDFGTVFPEWQEKAPELFQW